MAIAPPKPCARCGRLVRGKCEACSKRRAREQDAARPGATARGYDGKWATFARQWLERYPYCGQRIDGKIYTEDSECAQRGLRADAECVDHIQALKAGGKKFAGENLQSLCTRCNLRKGIAREGTFGRKPVKP
jgi:5-methylcytosine-specific restriction endonuclease McrA